MLIRAAYQKTGRMRFLAHLDLARTMHRAIARADIPIAYSEGFNPQPRVGFGPPVALGVEGLEEWVDLTLTRVMAPEDLLQGMNAALTEGLAFSRAFELPKRAASLGSRIRWARYRAEPLSAPPIPPEKIASALAGATLEINKRSKKGDTVVDVRDRVRELALDGRALQALLACGPEKSLGILDLMCHLTDLENAAVLAGYRVVRQKLYADAGGVPIPIDELPDESHA
ncbi:MAG: DUF2344 domain-containing protein [Candidatus Wallbacteria bacterium]|nr:DUF2344 domain-containing protein [Candidatus Wallbacteria bacterium]